MCESKTWQVERELSGSATRRTALVNWRGRRCVLRQDLTGDGDLGPDGGLEAEAGLMRMLQQSRIPVPEVLETGENTLLLEYLPGRNAGNWDRSACTPFQLVEAFELLARLHGLETARFTECVDSFDRWHPSLERSLPTHRLMRAECLGDLLHPYAFAGRPVLSHGDYHPGNLLFQGDLVSGLLDFEFAQLTWAEFDLAYALLTFSSTGNPGELDRGAFDSAMEVYLTRRVVDFRLLDFMFPVAALCLHDWVFALPQSNPRRPAWLAHCNALIRNRAWEHRGIVLPSPG